MPNILTDKTIQQYCTDGTEVIYEQREPHHIYLYTYDEATGYFIDVDKDDYLLPEELGDDFSYGKYWRIWDAEPSEELMAATPWRISEDEDYP